MHAHFIHSLCHPHPTPTPALGPAQGAQGHIVPMKHRDRNQASHRQGWANNAQAPNAVIPPCQEGPPTACSAEGRVARNPVSTICSCKTEPFTCSALPPLGQFAAPRPCRISPLSSARGGEAASRRRSTPAGRERMLLRSAPSSVFRSETAPLDPTKESSCVTLPAAYSPHLEFFSSQTCQSRKEQVRGGDGSGSRVRANGPCRIPRL